jgi:excisionase family DNA binding protein
MESIYISPAEFARRMDFNPATVRNWIVAGKIKAVVIRNPKRNHYRIPLSEVERFEKEMVNKIE